MGNRYIGYLLLALLISASNLNYGQTDNDLKELIPSFPVGLRIGAHNDIFSNTDENEFIDSTMKIGLPL